MIRNLFILFILSIILFARVNPFEPTNVSELNISNQKSKNSNMNALTNAAPKEVKKVILKSQSKDSITKEIYAKKNNKKYVSKKIKHNLKKKYIYKKINQANNSLISKNKKYIKPNILAEKINIIPVVPNAIRYNVFPLLSIDLLNNTLMITTSNNYKLIKYYQDNTNKKFVFDFKANVSIPSVKENLDSQYFKSYAVGNHLENGFFRVVIVAHDYLESSKVEVKNNTLVTIIKN